MNCYYSDLDVLSKSDGAQWWFTSMFGALLGSLLRIGRSGRRVEPMPPPDLPAPNEDEQGNKQKQKIEEPENTAAPLPASTQLGQLLHAIFEQPLCEAYEKVIVNKKGYRTVQMARWMTPQIFREVTAAANMTKSHMGRFREALAPPDFESRSLYPVFSAY